MKSYSLGAMLKGSTDSTRLDVTSLAVDLPPLLALTTLEVIACRGTLTAHLANFLSLIHSAPAPSSVIFRDLYYSSAGGIVDNKLVQFAMQAKTRRSFTVVLEGWVEENTKWEEYFPAFRKTGGQVVIGEILR